ncbi:MAG: tRNA (guanosine(37)-N1)-methyltransferase TrmD [Lachnospiraceae bacterium]|nr:tRNA (guanosine(37)-N1)-methyltransferase TrmD [Lachnospiraceae bacterium]
MRFHVLTLFPEMILNGMSESIIGRAIKNEYISLNVVNIRDYSDNKHMKVDDYPYGGGAGMVMQAPPVVAAYESIVENMSLDVTKKKPRVVYMTPQGSVFNQDMAQDFAKEEDLILLCGHYEGIDERALEMIVTDHVSIGDYVLTGGELPAMVVMDCVSRLVPNVLNNDESAVFESFYDGLLEHPQYTRPVEFRGKRVPEVLLSGNHKKIEEWRKEKSLERTRQRRPDLLEKKEKEKKENGNS